MVADKTDIDLEVCEPGLVEHPTAPSRQRHRSIAATQDLLIWGGAIKISQSSNSFLELTHDEMDLGRHQEGRLLFHDHDTSQCEANHMQAAPETTS